MAKKRKTKVLFFTDPHLGAVVGGYDSRLDQQEVLDALLVASLTADLVVCGGDVFHTSRPSPWAYAAFIDFLASLSCPALVLKGNHDENGAHVGVRSGDEGPEEVAARCRLQAADALEPLRSIAFESVGSTISWEDPFNALREAESSVFIPEFPGIMGFKGRHYLVAGNVSNAKARAFGAESAQAMVDAAFDAALRVGPKLAGAFTHLSVDGAVPGDEARFATGSALALPMEKAGKLHCHVLNGHQHVRQRIGNVVCPGAAVRVDFTSIEPGKKAKKARYYTLEV